MNKVAHTTEDGRIIWTVRYAQKMLNQAYGTRGFEYCRNKLREAQAYHTMTNPSRRDRPMYAPDMFLEGTRQVFSVRTGIFLGYDTPRSERTEQTVVETPVVISDRQQLTLF